MANMTPGEILTMVLAAASAILLIAQAVEKIVHAVKAARAPNERQNKRLDDLEEWRRDVDRKLLNDNNHLNAIDKGERVTQRALLALLEHGIDGNNLKQMKEAKNELQNHLINR